MIDESGWVIEHETSDQPCYLTLIDRQIGWSFENLKAFRMARREDAEAFSAVFLEGHGRIAEHGWYSK
jgi:hypothetical protein